MPLSALSGSIVSELGFLQLSQRTCSFLKFLSERTCVRQPVAVSYAFLLRFFRHVIGSRVNRG
jgi:hypothetical protein